MAGFCDVDAPLLPVGLLAMTRQPATAVAGSPGRSSALRLQWLLASARDLAVHQESERQWQPSTSTCQAVPVPSSRRHGVVASGFGGALSPDSTTSSTIYLGIARLLGIFLDPRLNSTQ